jgi:hypothetical protein
LNPRSYLLAVESPTRAHSIAQMMNTKLSLSPKRISGNDSSKETVMLLTFSRRRSEKPSNVLMMKFLILKSLRGIVDLSCSSLRIWARHQT